MRRQHISGHRTFSNFESLETRRLLAAAADLVRIAGESFRNEDQMGLYIGFEPKSHVIDGAMTGGLVTGRQTGDRAGLARDFLLDRAGEMGLVAADINSAVVTHRATDPNTGITYITFQQMLNGLKVDNTSAGVNFTRFGEVINGGGSLAAGMDWAKTNVAKPILTNMIHPTNALRAAAAELGLQYPAELDSLSYVGGVDQKFIASDPALSTEEIPVNAAYYATEDGVRLVWNTMLFLPNSADAYTVSIDAETGDMVRAVNMTAYFAPHDEWQQAMANRPATRPVVQHTANNNPGAPAAAGVATGTYNVYPLPFESPYDGPRSLVSNAWQDGGTDPATGASPYGWHDRDADLDPDFTDSRGNNVEAHDDINNNNSVTQAERAEGGPTVTFDFPIDFTQEPHLNAGNRNAAITNLFYWNNINHDIHYKYGFNEVFWNFQFNTYGRGGIGGDPVQADALDGSGSNNANFLTTADGLATSRMQMYRWTAPTPDLDGDLDAGIIAHEYGHGVSNRLHTNGGQGGTAQMASNQSRAMGEGWSDFFALMFQQTATDTINGRHPIGTYALNQNPDTGAGIRTHPYSWNTTTNPITWGYYGSGTYQSPYNPGVNVTRSSAVHWGGTIWAATLWDMNWNLITKHGYDSNLYTGYNPTGTAAEKAGNKLAMALVIEAMRLSVPTNPSFIESRNNILAADQALTGGQNQAEIWDAFARRGLGEEASSGAATSTATLTLSFDAPWEDPLVRNTNPTGNLLATPVSSLEFNFNQTMAQGSFSVVDDVASFTGPGGVDLVASITGSNWVDADTLRISFNTVVQPGAYSMTIGPNINAIDDNEVMDQNRNGVPGEPLADQYTGNFSISYEVGPETFGYRAAEFPFENIDLQIGDPGVTTHINASATSVAALSLGGNTFNFYGTTYTSLFASTEGLITFGATGSSSATNGPLTTSPTQAAIAPLWDSYTTASNAPGAGDSAVLYSFVGNNLIIEWSEVAATTTSNGAVTFQAILELNTGAEPGRIRFNYPDSTMNNATQSVGIKDTGTQTTIGRLLSLHNVTSTTTPGLVSPWVGDGKAIVIDFDVTPPAVNSSTYAFQTGQVASFVFNENVANFDPARIIVSNANATTFPIVAPLAVNYNPATLTGEVVLDAANIEDGNYTITVSGGPAGVADAAGNPIDGDLNFIAGGDHVFNFFFMRGDADHDRDVDIADFSPLAANFNTAGTFSDGDFDYSGLVDIGDFSILAAKFNTSLPAVGARAAVANAQSTLSSLRVTSSPFSDSTPIWSSIEQSDEMLPA